jgi:hypothetical protein
LIIEDFQTIPKEFKFTLYITTLFTYLVIQILDPKPFPQISEYLRTVFFELKMPWEILSERNVKRGRFKFS